MTVSDNEIPNSKYSRILNLYTRLINGEVINKADEAEKYGRSVRSIQYDIDDLRAYFVERAATGEIDKELVYDQKLNGYYLKAKDDNSLSNSEILAVCKILLESRAFCKDDITPLIGKLINNCVPKNKRQLVKKLVENELFHYIEPHHGKHFIESLWEIGEAVSDCKTMKITYERSDGNVVDRIVQPVGIMFSEYYFYLTAFIIDVDRNAVFDNPDDIYPTIYRIDRIRKLNVTNEKELTLEKQKDFADFYNERIKSYAHLLKMKQLSYSLVGKFKGDQEYQDIENMKIGKENSLLDNAALAVGKPLLELLANVGEGLEKVNARLERGEIWKRQYELLTCEFITNGFEKFINCSREKAFGKKAIIVYDPKDVIYSHLLCNLIQQYSDCDVAEYTENLFADNLAKIDSKNKLIFLGKTKSSEKRWLDEYRHNIHHNGMRCGFSGNNAFVYAVKLNKDEYKPFIEEYVKKVEEFDSPAAEYRELQTGKAGKNVASGINVAAIHVAIPTLPLFLLSTAVRTAALQGIGSLVDKVIKEVKKPEDLIRYQYELLLREFVFNHFEKFMEE